jgi:glycosyltransferase involved in cell wall biosynthesis
LGLEARGVDVVRYAVSLRAPADSSIRRWRVPARVAQSLWKTVGRPSIERLTGAVDLVHATNFVLPALREAPGVVTVHDLSFLRDDTFPGGRRLRGLVPWSVARSVRVLTPTRTIAAELADRLGVPDDKIAVTPEGVSPVFFGAAPLADSSLAHLGISRPFALAVGTLEPRKNLAALLQAWKAVVDPEGIWTLVLAGPPGWGPALPPVPGVVAIGWIGDETLPGLVAAAELFCYPSLYEGFGLPPLEAMAAGTPALVGRYSAAEEVVGADGYLVDPGADALSEGLATLLGDESLRRRLSISGRARAAEFTWARTAKLTEQAYVEAVEA